MKYTNEQRLDIGRRIYDGEISRYEAAEEYGINEQTARNYMRMYQDAKQLPPKREYVLRFAQFTRHDWKILGYFLSTCWRSAQVLPWQSLHLWQRRPLLSQP